MNPCLRQHQKWTNILVLLGAILVGCINGETGFRCYTCSGQGENNVCLTNPSAVVSGSVSVPCDQENGEFGWCYIVRQEYTDIPDSVVSFYRTCLKTEPFFFDDVIVDSDSTFMYRSCRTHLCNNGDGTESLPSGGGGGSGGAGGSHIIVESENSATSQSYSIILTLNMVFILIIRLL